jgi:hypothetical protein
MEWEKQVIFPIDVTKVASIVKRDGWDQQRGAI